RVIVLAQVSLFLANQPVQDATERCRREEPAVGHPPRERNGPRPGSRHLGVGTAAAGVGRGHPCAPREGPRPGGAGRRPLPPAIPGPPFERTPVRSSRGAAGRASPAETGTRSATNVP